MILNGLNVPEIDSPSPGAVPAPRETCLPNDPTPLISGVDWLELACFDLMNSVGSMEPCPSSREGIPGITLTEPTPMATDDAPIDLEALMSVFCTKPPRRSPQWAKPKPYSAYTTSCYQSLNSLNRSRR